MTSYIEVLQNPELGGRTDSQTAMFLNIYIGARLHIESYTDLKIQISVGTLFHCT